MTYYALCVRGKCPYCLQTNQSSIFDAYLDVRNGYVGYHSWDVTIGEVAVSDFYLVGIVPVYGFNGNTDL